MGKNSESFHDFSVQEAMKLAESDAGQKLLTYLQDTQGQRLQETMDLAAAGDYKQVKKAIQELMASGRAQELLKQLQGDSNG